MESGEKRGVVSERTMKSVTAAQPSNRQAGKQGRRRRAIGRFLESTSVESHLARARKRTEIRTVRFELRDRRWNKLFATVRLTGGANKMPKRQIQEVCIDASRLSNSDDLEIHYILRFMRAYGFAQFLSERRR